MCQTRQASNLELRESEVFEFLQYASILLLQHVNCNLLSYGSFPKNLINTFKSLQINVTFCTYNTVYQTRRSKNDNPLREKQVYTRLHATVVSVFIQAKQEGHLIKD